MFETSSSPDISLGKRVSRICFNASFSWQFANIFFVKEDKIYTPEISSGLLRGTMRDFLLENFEIVEEKIYAKDLASFDECFISNSLMGVRNVKAIDEIKFTGRDKTRKIQKKLKIYGF